MELNLSESTLSTSSLPSAQIFQQKCTTHVSNCEESQIKRKLVNTEDRKDSKTNYEN
jgi:hypothetical protein